MLGKRQVQHLFTTGTLTADGPRLDSLAFKTRAASVPPPSYSASVTLITYKDGQQNQVPREVSPERQATGFRGETVCTPQSLFPHGKPYAPIGPSASEV